MMIPSANRARTRRSVALAVLASTLFAATASAQTTPTTTPTTVPVTTSTEATTTTTTVPPATEATTTTTPTAPADVTTTTTTSAPADVTTTTSTVAPPADPPAEQPVVPALADGLNLVVDAAVDPASITEPIATALLTAPNVAPVSPGCTRTVTPTDSATTDSATTCELWARSGSAAIDSDTTLPVWVFDDSSSDPIDLLNPVLEAYEGDDITIDLVNANVPTNVALSLPAVVGEPDIAGIAAGGSYSYAFGPLEPGTYLYQAGPTPDGNRQIAMGMAGILIVRPADYEAPDLTSNSAFGNSIGEYGDEILALANEFDPRLNADPLRFDISSFSPTIFTLNGTSHDGSLPVPEVPGGSKVLVRAANLGSNQRRLGFSGVRHEQLSENSRLLAIPIDSAALTLPPGTVADAIAMMPLVEGDTTAVLLDNGLALFEGSSAQVAGQLSPYAIVAETAGTANTVLTSLSLRSDEVFDGSTDLLVDGVVDLADPDGQIAMRYFFDRLDPTDPGRYLANGGVTPPNPFGFTGYRVPATEVQSLTNGEHVLWVQAASVTNPGAAPEWGPVKGLVFRVDRDGPVVHSAEIEPSVSNGDAELTLRATADSTLTGSGTDIANVRFVIGDVEPTRGEMESVANDPALRFDAGDNPARAAVEGTIDVASLPEGVHTIWLFAKDSAGAGNWSSVATPIDFTIDRRAPEVTSGQITPSPNNGTLAYNGSQVFLPVVRMEAVISDPDIDGLDAGSPIVEAEFVFDPTGDPGYDPSSDPAGTGEPMQSATANWGTVDGNGDYVQAVYADLPLADLHTMPEGNITFWVRGRDAAGNWSDAFAVVFVHDTTAPEVVVEAANGMVGLAVTDPVMGADPARSGVVAAEWFIDGADPGQGLATPIALVPPAGANTSFTGNIVGPPGPIRVRALDAAGNWSVPTLAVIG